VINPKIASQNTIGTLQHLLTKKGEIEASAFLISNNVKIAGNAAAVPLGYANLTSKENKYLASYVGYYPANKPKYSVVCFIYNPQKNQPVYGSVECGGVIKEIVEKVK
jgi:cell division protein FtsI (penicillin-binding protein 3)